jgi:integrase
LRRAHEVSRDMRRDMARWWHRPVAAISREDIIHLVRESRTNWAAHHCFSYASRLFSWAVENGIVSVSPTYGLRPSRLIGEKRPRERVLTDDELRALWIRAGQLGYPAGPFIKMLILTGQRRGEVAGMQWSEIHNGLWVIPAARVKMKQQHVVPLVPEVRALLDALPRVSDLVFTTDGKRPIGGSHYIRKRLPGDGWTLHDLRRTMRTGLSALRVPTDWAERVIGHVPTGLVRVYDRHDYLVEKAEALHRWTQRLLKIVLDDNSFK